MIRKTDKKISFSGRQVYKQEFASGQPSVEDSKRFEFNNNPANPRKLSGYLNFQSSLSPKKPIRFNTGQTGFANRQMVQQKKRVQKFETPSHTHVRVGISHMNDKKAAFSNVVDSKYKVAKRLQNKMPVSSTGCATSSICGKRIYKMSTSYINDFIKPDTGKRSEDSPDLIQLSKAMTRTYPFRKAVYAKPKVNVADIRKFPGLLYYEMVKEEYGRILDDIQRLSKVESKLGPYLRFALVKATMRTGKTGISKWDRALQMLQGRSCGNAYAKNIGMLALCFLLAGKAAIVSNLCKILEPGQQLNSPFQILLTPTIVIQREDLFKGRDNCEIDIYVDRKKMLQVPNLYEAVLTAFAFHYLLNIEYDPKLATLFQFFDGISQEIGILRR